MQKIGLSTISTVLLASIILGSQQAKLLSIENNSNNDRDASSIKAESTQKPTLPLPPFVIVRPHMIQIPLGRQTVILPDGTKIEPNGTITTTEGLKLQPLIQLPSGELKGV
ncbi:MAG: hypothetical protein KME17_24845 [Cyanosarcina radialis HA8281-LM2]|jgi:hypothetical protein|nr:hypothetical protein [Cyanosarcina radialis HA8281-LM2]